jgi:hypothetical protein
MGELARALTYQFIEEVWDIGHETLRKFIEYNPETDFGTRTPHPRQREKYGKLYLAMNPQGYVMERKSDGTPGAIPPLKMVLPSGEDHAKAAIRELFRRAGEHPEGLPDGIARLEDWLKKILRAQYSVEKRYRRPKE